MKCVETEGYAQEKNSKEVDPKFDTIMEDESINMMRLRQGPVSMTERNTEEDMQEQDHCLKKSGLRRCTVKTQTKNR